ncbi:MAG: sodium:alanine symporter family protein [Chlamydiales bacterium]|nr:sodium:alanine symporter family protein [Chlamydiales bacterium]
MIHSINEWLWGMPLILLLTGAGLFLTIRLKGIQFRSFYLCHKLAFSPHADRAAGDISQFEAFSTSLASSIGIGSIAGVAVAVTDGGLGALFWMWITALLGMPMKYSESYLALKFREKDQSKEMCGGPMLYLERGLKAKWLALAFAGFTILSSLGIGNAVQAHSIAETLESTFSFPPLYTGIGLSVLVGTAILGGIKSIGRITSILVPIMSVFFIGAAFIILILYSGQLPSAIGSIFQSAFTPKALFLAIMMGAAQGVFSSEAGLGVAGIAASAAKASNPNEQSLIQMSTVSLTTLLVCTMTGLVLAVTGATSSGLTGSKLALEAFGMALPGGKLLLTIAIIPFGYSTILAWAYYAERSFDYLFGIRAIKPFRICFTLLITVGATAQLQTVWDYAHLANGLMILPNLIGLICLSGIVAKGLKTPKVPS